MVSGSDARVAKRTALGQLLISLLPALFVAGLLGVTWRIVTAPEVVVSTAGLIEAGGLIAAPASERELSTGLIGATEPEEKDAGLAEPPLRRYKESGARRKIRDDRHGNRSGVQSRPQGPVPWTAGERVPTPTWMWITIAVCVGILAVIYALWSWVRLEVFRMLLTSFFPLALLILAVLGSIVFGLSTPSEAAAIGAFGGFVLAGVYRFVEYARRERKGGAGRAAWKTIAELGTIIKESSFLTAKTSAMVCWLFVGSGIFSAAFALLGGQEVIEKWVLSLDMTPTQFMILAQFIIFILGWPLEWTEIIIIFMPIFLPLLPHFHIDPLFFGLLVALNLQTAFLSPPVAMAAFYLKGVSPPHVTLNQIFAGMLPFMGIQIVALALLYAFPDIGLWLPRVLYK